MGNQQRYRRKNIPVSIPPQSSEKQFNHIGDDFVYPSGDEIRDVFQSHHPEITPQKKSMTPPISLILTGVIYNGHHPIVILTDGQNKSYLARVNDTVMDFTVLKIEPISIILNRSDTQIELKVFKDKEIAAKF